MGNQINVYQPDDELVKCLPDKRNVPDADNAERKGEDFLCKKLVRHVFNNYIHYPQTIAQLLGILESDLHYLRSFHPHHRKAKELLLTTRLNSWDEENIFSRIMSFEPSECTAMMLVYFLRINRSFIFENARLPNIAYNYLLKKYFFDEYVVENRDTSVQLLKECLTRIVDGEKFPISTYLLRHYEAKRNISVVELDLLVNANTVDKKILPTVLPYLNSDEKTLDYLLRKRFILCLDNSRTKVYPLIYSHQSIIDAIIKWIGKDKKKLDDTLKFAIDCKYNFLIRELIIQGAVCENQETLSKFGRYTSELNDLHMLLRGGY